VRRNIYTLTLNPSIDYSFYIPFIRFDDINRIVKSRVDPGGKGINISRMLSKLGDKSISITFLTDRDNIYKNLLEKEGIKPFYIKIKGRIRNIYNFISDDGKILRFNEKGPKIFRKEKEIFFREIKSLNFKKGDIFVISGSLPDGFERKTYRKIVEIVKKSDVVTFIDADGEILKEAIKGIPYIIKPNLWELERATEEKIKDGKKLIGVVNSLFDKNIGIIILTLGEKGAIIFDRKKILYGRAEKVKVKSTVGCGDAFIAGFLYNFKRGEKMSECLSLAVACGTAKAKEEGTKMPEKEDVLKIMKKVKVKVVNKEWILKFPFSNRRG